MTRRQALSQAVSSFKGETMNGYKAQSMNTQDPAIMATVAQAQRLAQRALNIRSKNPQFADRLFAESKRLYVAAMG